ncbi:MAG: hypothetical protein HYZ83_07450 [Candidatus Omnitrophica bacterium]|nr:hypothetical protein [Candidatus Omnitrophota bacterium]
MNILTEIFLFLEELINQTSLLYFFSTLAQCAAAFAGLVGVFAIFRLQAQSSRIGEEYASAKHWLRTSPGVGNAEALSPIETKNWLEKIKKKEWQGNFSEFAGQVLERLLEVEKFNERLVYKVSKPLTWWAVIFLLSLMLIPISKWTEGLAGLLVVIMFLLVSGVALWKTKRFVQQCLDFK